MDVSKKPNSKKLKKKKKAWDLATQRYGWSYQYSMVRTQPDFSRQGNEKKKKKVETVWHSVFQKICPGRTG